MPPMGRDHLWSIHGYFYIPSIQAHSSSGGLILLQLEDSEEAIITCLVLSALSHEDEFIVNLWHHREDIAALIVHHEHPNHQHIELLQINEVVNVCWLQCLDVTYVFASKLVRMASFKWLLSWEKCLFHLTISMLVQPHQVIPFSPFWFPQLITNSYGSQVHLAWG